MIKINHRLKKLEQRLLPSDDGACTLEELCRAMWRQDSNNFLRIAEDTSLRLFVRQFESDAVESAEAGRQTRRRE
jgi:hypothetical protein